MLTIMAVAATVIVNKFFYCVFEFDKMKSNILLLVSVISVRSFSIVQIPAIGRPLFSVRLIEC